jgi:hypothetical protein
MFKGRLAAIKARMLLKINYIFKAAFVLNNRYV